jgi:hypothetical protein
MRQTSAVSTLRISLTVFTDNPSGYGAEAAVDSHGIRFHSSARRTPQTAVNAVVADLLKVFPNWMVRDRGLQRGLEAQLVESLTTRGADHLAGELKALLPINNPRELRAIAARAVSEGTTASQAAAIALLADLEDTHGVHQTLTLEALRRLIETLDATNPTT